MSSSVDYKWGSDEGNDVDELVSSVTGMRSVPRPPGAVQQGGQPAAGGLPPRAGRDLRRTPRAGRGAAGRGAALRQRIRDSARHRPHAALRHVARAPRWRPCDARSARSPQQPPALHLPTPVLSRTHGPSTSSGLTMLMSSWCFLTLNVSGEGVSTWEHPEEGTRPCGLTMHCLMVLCVRVQCYMRGAMQAWTRRTAHSTTSHRPLGCCPTPSLKVCPRMSQLAASSFHHTHRRSARQASDKRSSDTLLTCSTLV